MTALKRSQQELARLEGLRDSQAAKAKKLEAELAEARESMGERVLEAMNAEIADPGGEVARQVRDLADRVEAEAAGLGALEGAIKKAQKTVDREQAIDNRQRASTLRKEAKRLAGKRGKLIQELARLEQVEAQAIRYEVWQGPAPLSVRLTSEADELERNASFLDSGIPPQPVSPPLALSEFPT
jgi:uncharacterized phage infection (PIP) family protein YhgE